MEESETRTSFFIASNNPVLYHTYQPLGSMYICLNNSSGSHLLNAMCDLTQFFVSIITMETHVKHLVKLFMKNLVLLFDIISIIIVNSDSRFMNVFKDIFAVQVSSIVFLHVGITKA